MIQLSARGAQFIGTFEGWRDKPYNDAANNATIGYGHLIHMGPVTPHDVSEWGTLSKPDGIRLLQSDAHLAETAIAHSITRTLPAWAWKGRVEARPGRLHGPRGGSGTACEDRSARHDPALGLDLPPPLPVAPP